MSAVDHAENPLTGYRTLDGDYRAYLHELESTFRQVVDLLRVGGHLVVDVADPVTGAVVTPLGPDLGERIGRRAVYRRRIAIAWDEPPSASLANECLLVFTKTTPRGR